TGEFAREWLLENKVNAPRFKRMRDIQKQHQLEAVGKKLRKLMSWIDSKEF
ncbi:MAG: ketol-acid reductoisomerase, partial [Planctomycetaceae bacterium]|nr:ketol-acid reductoisomerase [Planctomycetaceae bacterium]